MPASGTFDYVAIVPDDIHDGSFECVTARHEAIIGSGDRLQGSRLVGGAPRMRVSDAGLTPDAGPQRPLVLRSCITLTASARHGATVAKVSFHVDKALARCVRAGDAMHVVRTGSGGLGVSVIRDGALVVAAGAVTDVPLGRAVEARIPSELVERAAAAFCERDPGFTFAELPIEFNVNGSRSIFYRGSRVLQEYEVWIVHGFLAGIPGTDACAAIWRTRMCPDVAANASAMLLDDRRALTISRW